MWHSRNPSSKFTCIIRKHYQKFILSKSIFNIFIKNLFKIKYKFLYRTLLNTWVLLMIFNEILIPQDSFTETNVTRKRSVVGNSYHLKKTLISFFFCKHITFFRRDLGFNFIFFINFIWFKIIWGWQQINKKNLNKINLNTKYWMNHTEIESY